MKKPLIVMTYPFPGAREWIGNRADIKYVRNLKDLPKALSKADALITLLLTRIDAELLKHGPRLKVVGNYAVGIDNIDLQACKSHGIKVVNTPKVLTRSTAELTVALLFACARRFHECEALIRKNQFRRWDPALLLGQELKNRQAVIVGRGRIGKETAKLFRALGIQVKWITRKTSGNEIKKFLRTAQILSLHLPLNSNTWHWLDAKKIALLPKDSIVLNPSRGPLIDEKALIQALKKRRIFSAGLDVYEFEPQVPAALRKLPNTILLPHVGSATEHARTEMARAVITGVLAILDGKRPWNQVV